MKPRTRVWTLAMLSLLCSVLVMIPAPPASAMGTVIAADLTDTGSLNLTSFTNDPTTPFTSAADGFGPYQRGVSLSIPFALLDDTTTFSPDVLGIIDSTTTGPFFGVSDTQNPDTSALPVTARWVFDITGGADLAIQVDVGAMGDFESTDRFEWNYRIDGGPLQPLLALAVDENATLNYTMESGKVVSLDDPMTANGVVLSNVLTTLTAPVVGTGSSLEVSFTADTNGEEAVAFRNLLVLADAAEPPPIELVINEVMQNPAAVSDSAGEWFELHNVGAGDVDIDGWTVRDNGSDSFTIANGGPLVVPAGGFVVLGNNSDSAVNGGVTVDYAYGTSMFLANGDDEIIIEQPDGTEIDRIEYDGGPAWPDPTGAAMNLDPASVADNNNGANWCESPSGLPSGDNGTPGAANPTCPEPPVEPTLIHAIQGSGPTVDISGAVLVEAVVTSLLERDDVLDGFFLQEEDAQVDGNPATSEGIFVFCRDACPTIAVGDLVQVAGTATEAFGMSQIDMRSGSASVISSGNPLPTASVLNLPAGASTLAESTFENLEGMVITIPDTLAVSEYFQLARFGQVVLTETSRPFQFTHLNAPSPAGYAAFLEDLERRRIILDDDNNDNNDAISDGPDEPYFYADGGLSTSNRFRGGDTIAGLTGVLHWSFAGSSGTDAWRVRPIDGVENRFTPANAAPFTPPEVGGTIKVASFNVLNYFATIDTGAAICGPAADQGCRGADSVAELDRQRAKIVSAISTMDADVVGLIELENDNDTSIADLVAGLNATLGAGTYEYLATGFIGADVIKVGYIYQPASVQPVGDFVILDSGVDPTFVDTENRPVLIQTFEEVPTGERFTVAVNHLKSKGSDCDALGDPDLGDGQANCSQTRAAGAAALASYLATDPTGSEDPDFLIIGDLNAYAMGDAVTALTGAGYTDLLAQFVGPDAYSFVFDGQLGYLDHGLANPAMLEQVTGAAVWNINADEVNVFDYNDDVADAGEQSFERESAVLAVFSPDQFRSSDHDPVLVGLLLDSIPDNPECQGQPATIVGTAGADVIFGTNGDDVIVTFGGDDYIDAGNGSDLICSGAGADEINAGNGKDIVEAGSGDDVVWGDNGKDELFGGAGFDLLDGGNGDDTCVDGEALSGCEF